MHFGEKVPGTNYALSLQRRRFPFLYFLCALLVDAVRLSYCKLNSDNIGSTLADRALVRNALKKY